MDGVHFDRFVIRASQEIRVVQGESHGADFHRVD